jgi:hypothetical protein
MSNPWDFGARPNLARLPAHVKEQMSQPVPLRPEEVLGRLMVFQNTSGLNHPNARFLVTAFREGAENYSGPPDGAQLDVMDFSGRVPLSSMILPKTTVESLLVGLARCYLEMGGTIGELESINTRALTPVPLHNVSNFYEEKPSDE